MAPKLVKSNVVLSQESEVFQLAPSPSNSNPHYKTVKIDFGCVSEKSKTSKFCSKQRWPKYNTDGVFYTPAFVIPEDMAVLSLVQQRLKDEHMKKIKTNTQCSTKVCLTSLIVPCSEQQSYCSVCKTYYKNMDEVNFQQIQHLNSNNHKTSSLKSPYTKHIYQFCHQYFPKVQINSQQKMNTSNIFKEQVIRKNTSQKISMENISSSQSIQYQFSPQESSQFFGLKPTTMQLDISPPIRKRRLC